MIVKRIITMLVGIPIIIMVVHLGTIPILVLLMAVVVLALMEFFRMLDACKYRYQKYPGFLTVVFLLIGFYLQVNTGIHFPAAIITVFIMVFLSVTVLSGNLSDMISSVSITLFGVMYIGWLSGHLVLLRGIDFHGESLVYLLFFVTWFSDIFAYLVGKKFGRHKMAQRISPGKSWEGAVAGLAAAVVIAVAWREVSGWEFLSRWNLSLRFLKPFHCVLMGLLLGIGGQVGDLAESMLKRNAGVKDSGSILPGHGGMLDRCDSLLFNIPLLYYFVKFIMK